MNRIEKRSQNILKVVEELEKHRGQSEGDRVDAAWKIMMLSLNEQILLVLEDIDAGIPTKGAWDD